MFKNILSFFKKKTKPNTFCDHGVVFDLENVHRLGLNATQIRALYPRLCGVCPKGCGFEGIAYASQAHFVYGDW